MARKKAEDVDELLDELDEVEEDVEELDEEDEFEEEPDAKPTKSKRSRAKAASKPRKEREGVGTNEVAAEAGITPRSLRMLLRAEFEKPEDGWRWKSMNHPQVKAVLKRVRQGGATEARDASLEKVKGSKKKTSGKKSSKKKASAKRSRAKAE